MTANTQPLKLYDGTKLPNVGFGAYNIPIDETEEVITDALKTGYRLIDSAMLYMNEAQTAKAIAKFVAKQENVARADIIYGSKVWESDFGYERAKTAVARSLKRAECLGYIDYYLVHSANGGKKARLETYRAVQEAAEEGKIKHIGVSNWGVKHLKELFEWDGLKIKPSLNQIELNPWLQHGDILEFCKEKGVAVMAYSPLTCGQRLDDPELIALAEKYNRTPAQILVRWAVQRNTLPIPKTVKASRMAENLDTTSWQLSDEDFEALGNPNDYYLAECWDPTVAP